jgi:serine/threonine-protein kinase RsbW
VKSTGKRVSYTMDSTLETVNRAEELAQKTAAEFGFEEDERDRIAIAVREGTVNAVLHGNKYAPDKKVTLAFENTDGGLAISITDQGAGLNPESIPDPLAPENLLKTSGRGIFLMRAFMDEVRFRGLEPGTEVTMLKRRSNAAGGKEEKS